MSETQNINHAVLAQKVAPKAAALVRKDIPSMIKPHIDRVRQQIMSKVGQIDSSEKEELEIESGLDFVYAMSKGLDDPTVQVICPREETELLSVQRETGDLKMQVVYPLEQDTLTPNTSERGSCAYATSSDPNTVFSYTAQSNVNIPFNLGGVMTCVPTAIDPTAWALCGPLTTPDRSKVFYPNGRIGSANGGYTPFFAGNSVSWSTDTFKYHLTALEPGDVGGVSITTFQFNGGTFSQLHTPIGGISNGMLLQSPTTSTAINDGFAFIVYSTEGVDLSGVRFKFAVSRINSHVWSPTVCPMNMNNIRSNLFGDSSANRMNIEAVEFVISVNKNKNLTGGWGNHAQAQSFPALAVVANQSLYSAIGDVPMKKKKYSSDVGTSGFILCKDTRLKSASCTRDEPVRFGEYTNCDIDTSYGSTSFTMQLTFWTTYYTSGTKSLKVQSPGSDAMWAYNRLLLGDSIWENPDHHKHLNNLRTQIREHVEGKNAPQLSAKQFAKQKVFTKKNAERLMNGAVDLAELVL